MESRPPLDSHPLLAILRAMKRIIFLAALLAGATTLSSCGLANGLTKSVSRSVNRLAGAVR